MKKTLLALLVIVSVLTACNKEPKPLTRAQIKQKIDSITAERIKESDAQARLELEHRIKIEVKVKVDSIVNARLQPLTPDTVRNRKPTRN